MDLWIMEQCKELWAGCYKSVVPRKKIILIIYPCKKLWLSPEGPVAVAVMEYRWIEPRGSYCVNTRDSGMIISHTDTNTHYVQVMMLMRRRRERRMPMT